ncbi:MAG: hypothetical protein V7735_08850 [Photobacterium frigidiphilum]|uniref:hypothetical protein n=1 Tax=Photobacterium frigidiphilum TaxID=264736 RepID=UPI003001DF65
MDSVVLLDNGIIGVVEDINEELLNSNVDVFEYDEDGSRHSRSGMVVEVLSNY